MCSLKDRSACKRSKKCKSLKKKGDFVRCVSKKNKKLSSKRIRKSKKCKDKTRKECKKSKRCSIRKNSRGKYVRCMNK